MTSKHLFRIALVGILTLALSTAVQADQLQSDADHFLAAAIAVVAVVVVVTVVLIHQASSNRTVTGCISSAPNGMLVTSEKDKRVYALSGYTAGIKPGERMTLHLKKIKTKDKQQLLLGKPGKSVQGFRRLSAMSEFCPVFSFWQFQSELFLKRVTMKTSKRRVSKSFYSIIPLLLLFLFCPEGTRAQYLIVDCTGATPGAYSSINAALPNATPGSFILVTGPCTENVSLSGVSSLSLGAYYGFTATLNGGISIGNSQNVMLYGLNVTNTAGTGISVSNSRGISLNVCSSSGNAGMGLSVAGMSDVTVGASGAFDNNGNGGININGNSLVALVAWAGPVDISNNSGPGVWESAGSLFSTLGPTTITNNVSGVGTNPGYGLELLGGARAQIGSLYGPNRIAYNQAGGAFVQENSEISFFSLGQANVIQGNGPVGVSVGLGSQVTFFDITGPVNAQIAGHTSAGVDIYSNSQAYFNGSNQILQNGAVSSNPRSAGIRVWMETRRFYFAAAR